MSNDNDFRFMVRSTLTGRYVTDENGKPVIFTNEADLTEAMVGITNCEAILVTKEQN